MGRERLHVEDKRDDYEEGQSFSDAYLSSFHMETGGIKVNA